MDQKLENQQLIITLTLIKKAIEDIVIKVDEHHITLYGDGKPEQSVMWGLTILTQKMQHIEDQLATVQKKLDSTDNITWEYVLKKISIKAPWILVVIFGIILLHGPAAATFMTILKFFGLGV